MSIRVSQSLSLKERKVYTFDNFRGVDFSTSPYKVAQNRAISAENLLYENGTVRKRNGWRSLCKLPDEINGIFSFEIENENIVLVYAGTKFYRLTWDSSKNRYIASNITNTCTYTLANIDTNRLISQRIQLYINKNKAYIVGCGDYLVYGKWGENFELRRVFDNEDTYIPTTTINIDNDSVADENRASFDAVNLLSSYRKNEMLGVDNSSATWSVDTMKINSNSDVSIEIYTLDAENNQELIKINNRITSDKTQLYKENDDINAVGEIDYGNGKIKLNINTKPQEADTSNIIITFKCSEEGQDDFIINASLSTLFGGGGNSNRLFLTGSKTRKNVHVWSEMYDFTYFADTNYDEIGSDNSAILGYVRATDGVLIVFKEKNGADATIYYISGADTEEEDYAGNISFVTRFTKYAGNISDTIYARYATASLNGDNLILTRNGVRGLELYDNLATSAYRLRERSRNINVKLLKEENLQDACGFVYQDKYYLSVGNVVYVCDSRFTFQADEDISDSFNYEWWYLTNVNARVWCEIDNKLLFGTTDGHICIFEENNYADTTFQDTEAGDLSVSFTDDKILFNLSLNNDLNESSSITITQGKLYSLFLDDNELLEIDEDGYISVGEETLTKLYQGIKCYADRVDGTGLLVDTQYEIGEVDLDNIRFKLIDTNGSQVIPTNLGFRLCKELSNKTLYVTNVDTENAEFQIKEFSGGDVLDLVIYNYTMPTELLATICFKQNVVSKWFTPICDLGTNMYSKTLLGMSITTEPLVKGAVTIGYQTRNIEKDFITYGTKGFDFNDIDFEDFSFESSFTNSNTIRVKERNFNFIIIRYVSDTQSACAVNGITIRYKINRLNKGVR